MEQKGERPMRLLTAESILPVTDLLRKIHIENKFLIPISLKLADTPDLFCHSINIGLGYKTLALRLNQRDILDENNVAINEGIVGAFGHDLLGKVAIVNSENPPRDSMAVVNFVSVIHRNRIDQDATAGKTDGRDNKQRARINTHPLVGYEMYMEMIRNGTISGKRNIETVLMMAQQALNHHKTDGKYKPSYPIGLRITPIVLRFKLYGIF